MRNGSPTPRSALTKDIDFEATGAWTTARDFSGFHRLAQLATQLGGCAAAVVLDTTQWPPLVLGVHGVSGDTAASAAQYSATAFPERNREAWVDDLSAQHERDGSAAGTEWARMRRAHWLPVAPAGGQGGVALLLLDPAVQPQKPPVDTTLNLLTAHAAEVLALWRRCEVSEQYNVNVLRESESRLNLTEHTAGAGSWSMQVSTGLVTHSDEFATILGLPDHRHVVSLDSMVQRYNPEWRSGIRQRLERCAVSGEGFDEEIQIMVEGGTPKWVRTVGTAVRNKEGNILRIQGAIQDISAQKQAQQDTLRLAMRLTTTLASITEAFVTLDRQCCFTYLNQESERLLQKTTADLLGEEVWKDFTGGLADRLKEKLTRSLNTNRRVELEDFFPSLGKWLEVRAYPFAEGLAVYFRDVTERRRSQEQLMLLETSVSRLNDIVAIAETGASAQEPRIVFVNDAFEQHTGYSRAEVLGQTPRMLLELDPAITKLKALAAGLQQNQQARTELMVRRKNGALFWVELEVVSVQANAEEVTHWVAVGRDITQRKTAEDMIRHLAFYDALTDLPNRQLLLDRLQQALAASARSGQHGALMFIDLDNFKVLNDTLGHHMGDQLLQKVASRLTRSVRKTDMVARLGGDEFVVMFEGLKAPVVDAEIMSILVDRINEPLVLDNKVVPITASIGMHIYEPGSEITPEQLLCRADEAMYAEKRAQRSAAQVAA